MIQTVPQRSHKINLLAHTALALLGAAERVRETPDPISEASRAALEVLEMVAWEQENRPHHDTSLEVEIEDWNVLFCAVKYRLLIAIDEQLSTPECRSSGAANRAAAVVRECVGALQKLHRALTQERTASCSIALTGLGMHATLLPPGYD